MFQASRLKTSLSLFFAVFLLASLVLFATPEKAEASTLSSGRAATYFSATSFGAMPSEHTAGLQTFGGARPIAWWDSVASALNDVACFNAIGATLSATTGVCDDSPIGSVVEKIEEALDCVKKPMDCVTKYIFDVLGGAVGWVVNGIVTLVTGTNEECIRGGDTSPTFNDDTSSRESLDQRLAGFDSSSAWSTAQDLRCSERIALDYFGPGAGETESIFSGIQEYREHERQQVVSQIREMRQNGVTSGDEFDALVARQAALDETEGEVSEADALTSGGAVENSVFYVPKSTVSTETFKREYGKYVIISLMIMVPMIIAAALQSVISGKAALMMRGVFIHMPVAIFGMIIAPYLVRTLMAITDTFSAFIIADVQNDVQGFYSNSSEVMVGLFISFGVYILLPAVIIVLIFLIAALFVWFILNVREASIALVSVFLPVALAASIWPALGSWAIKAIKLLMASIISKIFIVGAISLGIGIFTGGADTDGIGFSLSHLVYGSVIFFIAAFQPMLVLKFMDEIGDSMTNNGSSGAWLKAAGALSVASQAGDLAGRMLGKGGGGGGAGGGGAGGGASTVAKAGMKGANIAKNAMSKGATKGDAAMKGAKGAANAAKAGGGGAADQGAAAGNAYKASGGGGGDAGASQMGGLAAMQEATSSGASASQAGQAAGMGFAGAGGSASDAGQFAYGAAISQGATPQEAQSVRNDVTNQLTPKKRFGRRLANKGFGKRGGVLGYAMKKRSENQNA